MEKHSKMNIFTKLDIATILLSNMQPIFKFHQLSQCFPLKQFFSNPGSQLWLVRAFWYQISTIRLSHSHTYLGQRSLGWRNNRRYCTRTKSQCHGPPSTILPWRKGNAGDDLHALKGKLDPVLWGSPNAARKSLAHHRWAGPPCLALPINSEPLQGAVSK